MKNIRGANDKTVVEDKEEQSMDIDEILRQAAVIVAGEMDCNYRLFLFGSRAFPDMPCCEKSDIDIGIISESPITGKQSQKIMEELEQIPTLLKIDFVDFNTLDHEFKKIALEHTRDITL